jgi:hypothetical protein
MYVRGTSLLGTFTIVVLIAVVVLTAYWFYKNSLFEGSGTPAATIMVLPDADLY